MVKSKRSKAKWLGNLIQLQSRELICTHQTDGLLYNISPSVSRLLGYHPGEVEGQNPLDFLHPDDHALYFQLTGDPGLFNEVLEWRFRTKAGNYIWLQTLMYPFKDKKTKKVLIYSSSRDVTAEKQSRQGFDRLQHLMKQMSQMAEIGGWEYDPETESIHATEQAFYIFGVCMDEEFPSFKNVLSFFDPDARKTLLMALNRTIENHEEYKLELPLKSANGEEKWIQTMGMAVARPGRLPIINGTIREISVAKQNELQLKEHISDLEAMSASLGKQNQQLLEFSYIISHNLRGPVGNLVTLANFLRESESADEQEMIIDKIHESSSLLNRTFEELMEVLKVRNQSEIKLEAINLYNIIGDTAQLFDASIRKNGGAIFLHIDPEIEVPSFPVYLKSIAVNLISNSIKYRDKEKGGLQISISFEINEEGEKCLIFKDNGLGIDMKRYGDKVFRLHKTFHRHPDARGFGLFMSKNQMEAMGGEIRLTSEVGKGCTFTLVFNPATKSIQLTMPELF